MANPRVNAANIMAHDGQVVTLVGKVADVQGDQATLDTSVSFASSCRRCRRPFRGSLPMPGVAVSRWLMCVCGGGSIRVVFASVYPRDP